MKFVHSQHRNVLKFEDHLFGLKIIHPKFLENKFRKNFLSTTFGTSCFVANQDKDFISIMENYLGECFTTRAVCWNSLCKESDFCAGSERISHWMILENEICGI